MGVPPEYLAAFQQATAQYPNVPPGVLFGVIQQEHGWRRDPVGHMTSSGRVSGLAQFLDSTARALGVDPQNDTQAILGAARLLSQNLTLFGGNVRAAIAGYNTNPAVIQQHGLGYVLAPDYAGGETMRYVQAVERFAGEFGGSATGGPPVASGTPAGPSGGNPVLGCLPGAAGGAAALLGALWWLGVCR